MRTRVKHRCVWRKTLRNGTKRGIGREMASAAVEEGQYPEAVCARSRLPLPSPGNPRSLARRATVRRHPCSAQSAPKERGRAQPYLARPSLTPPKPVGTRAAARSFSSDTPLHSHLVPPSLYLSFPTLASRMTRAPRGVLAAGSPERTQ